MERIRVLRVFSYLLFAHEANPANARWSPSRFTTAGAALSVCLQSRL